MSLDWPLTLRRITPIQRLGGSGRAAPAITGAIVFISGEPVQSGEPISILVPGEA